MSLPSAVVLVVDRLSQGFLGPYGNTVVRTPEFDALAAESFVFDQALIADPQLEQTYAALWTLGKSTAAAKAAGSPEPHSMSLAAALSAAGVATCLVTDEPRVATHPRAMDFAQHVVLAPRAADECGTEVGETGLAELFLAASEWLRGASAQQPFLLWIHARGMEGPWDAPYALREQYVDEEDPPAPRFTAVPDLSLAEDYDPDTLLGITQAYLGQVSLVDTCLGVLREELAAVPDALFCCSASRGFPLGEHRRVGGQAPPLYGELLQIPLLLRLPGGVGALGRSPALVQLSDLAATLLAWWSLDPTLASADSHDLLPLAREEASAIRQAILFRADSGDQAVRTPAWSLRASGPPNARRLELFAKPSDRWEVNQVADRAPQIAEQLAALLSSPADAPAPTELDAALVEPLD